MELNYKTAAVLAIAVGGLIAGAFTLGKKQGETAVGQTAAAPAGTPQAGAVPAQAQAGAMAPGQAALAQGPEPQREGKVGANPNDKFSHFRVGNKNVKSIYADGKVMWIGTSGGVIRYDTASDNYKVFDAKSGLLSNGLFYVGRVQGKITVGTYGGGMSMFDEKEDKWEHFNIPDGLGDAFVYEVLEAKNGDLWIATWSGVNRVKGGKLRDRAQWELYTVENTNGGVPNDWVYGLAEGKNGDIWLATEGGLALWREGKWTNWNHAKGLGAPYEKVKEAIAYKSDPSKQSVHHAKQKEEMGLQNVDVAYNPNYIVSLEVDKDGVVWAGTWGGGLGRFDGKTWKNYTSFEGLPGNHVFMLHIDPAGQMWVGTNAGLVKFKDGKVLEKMGKDEGLFGNDVFSMATQEDGSLWIGSFGGVSHIRLK